MMTLKSIFTLSLLLIISACAPYPKLEPTQKSNLTVGTAKTKIIKGETSQAEILELFGAPNLITINKDNDEVWNYNRMSVQKMGARADDIWFGSRAISSMTTSSFDLIIIFDEKDIVKNYSIISTSY